MSYVARENVGKSLNTVSSLAVMTGHLYCVHSVFLFVQSFVHCTKINRKMHSPNLL